VTTFGLSGAKTAGAKTASGKPTDVTTRPGQEEDRPVLLLLHWWHAAFAVTLVFTATWTASVEHPATRVGIATGCYALLGIWYVVAPGGLVRGRSGGVYLAGALLLFAVSVAVTPYASFLLFILIPHCFVVLPLRPAFAAILGLSALSSAAQLERTGISRGDALSVTIFGVMTVLLSVLIGGWVTRVAEQSQQRAELIDELDRTRAELARASREAGTAAERARLAGEIHDTLAQGFTSILMLLQTAQAGLAPAPGTDPDAVTDTVRTEAVRTQLALAASTARDALAEARSFVAALAPVPLQSAPLLDAVRRVVEDFGARSGVRAHLEVTGVARDLPAATEVVLLRATQEALANIHRHAGATTATVHLAFGVPGSSAAGSSLTVTDDGCGIDPAIAPGYGLRGMRARVEQAGGRLRVGSAGVGSAGVGSAGVGLTRSGGTRVELYLP
jgi:signal transduction histidine kinase